MYMHTVSALQAECFWIIVPPLKYISSPSPPTFKYTICESASQFENVTILLMSIVESALCGSVEKEIVHC